MRKIAVINQKGGVGKTTTTVNLAAALANAGKRVCVLDLDPQAHASTHLGVEPDGTKASLYDVLVANKPLAEVRQSVGENLWLVPADINLAAAEVELAGIVGREVILREAMARDAEQFDFVIMDCGPSLGVLTLNVLVAAERVVVPLQPEYYALEGITYLMATIDRVRASLNPALTVEGIVLTMWDPRNRLAHQVADEVKKHFRVFDAVIPRNVRL